MPLCCTLEDLTSLAPYSVAGIACLVVLIGAMVVRQSDGTYENIPGLRMTADATSVDTPDLSLALCRVGESLMGATVVDDSSTNVILDALTSSNPSVDPTIHIVAALQLACTLATAFVGHYNAPRMFQELNQDESSFQTVTKNAYLVSASLMAVVALVGFLTFGKDSLPLILNNYNPMDSLMNASRSLLLASLVLTFPLPFVGLRDTVSDCLPETVPTHVVSAGLLVALTATAMAVDDISLVLTVGGGTIATAVASVLPTLMYRQVIKRETNNQEPVGALLQMGLSVGICIAGVIVALQST